MHMYASFDIDTVPWKSLAGLNTEPALTRDTLSCYRYRRATIVSHDGRMVSVSDSHHKMVGSNPA